jgi:hypothetical protein
MGSGLASPLLEEAATLRGRICHPEAAASREALARARAGAR